MNRPKMVVSQAIQQAVMPPARPEALSLLAEEGFLRLSQIIGDATLTPPRPPIIPVSKSTLWDWVRKGKFPKPIKLGARTTVWRVSDVRAWLAAQNAGQVDKSV